MKIKRYKTSACETNIAKSELVIVIIPSKLIEIFLMSGGMSAFEKFSCF